MTAPTATIARPPVASPPAVRLARRLPAAAAFVVALLLASTGAAALHLRATVSAWIGQGLPEDALLVSPGRMTLGPLSLGSTAVPLSLYEELGQDPRVTALAIEEALTVPARVHGSIAGHAYGSDVAVLGIDGAALAWLAPGIPAEEFQDASPLPVLAPRLLLDAYNSAFAPSQGLPRLAANAFVGRTFTLEAGASSLGSSPSGSRPVSARLAGFADRGELMGVLAPLAWVRRMNAELGGSEARRIVLFPASPSDAMQLAAELRGRGFEVSEPAARSRQLARLDLLLVAGAFAASIVLGLLAASSSAAGAAALLLACRDEVDLMHQLAESRGAIIRGFALRLAPPAGLGAAAGAAIGLAITLLVLPDVLAAVTDARGAASTAALLAATATAALVPIAAAVIGAAAAAAVLVPRWKDRA